MPSRKTIHFVSLGCPKNRVDSEVMLGVAQGEGYAHVDDAESADVIVINTCGFIGEAKKESVDAILEAGRHKNQVVLLLAGVHTRNQAEALVGQVVQGDRRQFPPLPPGEYYWFQVLGLPVVNVADGALLGYLESIIPTPAHDVYVVRQGEREVLLPAVEDVIVEINLEEGVLKASPPEGLL